MQRPSLLNRILLIVILTVATLIVFSPVCSFDFVNWDDGGNIYNNPYLNPPSSGNILFFWKGPYNGLYIPLTYTVWLAVALISQKPGSAGKFERLNPGFFHATNLVFHIASVIVVFYILRLLIKHSPPKSCSQSTEGCNSRVDLAAAIGASLFALHPLQAEPVAWVTGLKDVLCGFLSFTSIWIYLLYATTVDSYKRHILFVAATVIYLLALLAKPTAVVVPLIVWVLDYFLLTRSFKKTVSGPLVWAIISMLISVLTISVQPLTSKIFVTPFYLRPFIVLDSVTFYLGKLLFPFMLIHDYSRTPEYVLSLSFSRAAYLFPFLLIGIVWFQKSYRRLWLVSLSIFFIGFLPVSGIVPFGYQSFSTVADRYLYISMIGPAMLFADVVNHSRQKSVMVLSVLILSLMVVLSAFQAGYWQDIVTLLTHTIKINPRSHISYYNMGIYASDRGDIDEAINHFSNAIKANGNYAPAHNNLGNMFARKERLDEAVSQYLMAIKINPEYARAHYNLGVILFYQGKVDEAVEHYYKSLQIDPDIPSARKKLLEALEVQKNKALKKP